MRTRAGAEAGRVHPRSFASTSAAFLEEWKVRRYSRSATTQAQRVLRRLAAALRRQRVTDPRRVTEAHLARFARGLTRGQNRAGEPLSPWTQRAHLSVVKSFFRFLEKRRLILRNPAQDLAQPQARRLPRHVLSEAQVRKLMTTPAAWGATGRRDRALLEVLYGTALRVGECGRLDLTDMNLGQGTLLVRNGKGQKDRVVPLVGRAAAALELYISEARGALLRDPREPAVFLSFFTGRRMAPMGIQGVVKRYKKAAGIAQPLTPHSLRHACATHLLRAGVDVRHLKDLLGHRRIETTELYTKVAIKDLAEVMARTHPRDLRKDATQ